MDIFEPKDIYEFWKNGKDINSAITEYLDLDAIKKRAIKRPGNINQNSYIEITGLLEEKIRAKQKLDDYSQFEQETYKELSEKIKHHEILVIGYKKSLALSPNQDIVSGVPFGDSQFPELIDRKIWPPKTIILEQSVLIFEGFRFDNVRVVINPDMETTVERTTKTDRGRPTRENEIKDAYESLVSRSKIDYSKYFKDHIKLIRKEVYRLNPDIEGDEGLSDKTIQDQLSGRFQTEKKTHTESE